MDVSLRVRIVRATKRNGREVLNRVKCVRHLLHSSTELHYTTYRLPTWLVSICGFYSLARSHQTVPKPRTTWNELCQKSKLLTDLPCRLHLKSFLNLEFLQGQVRYSLRNKTKKRGGGDTFQLLLCVSCVMSFPALLLTGSRVAFQESISCTAHLSPRGNCF